MENRIKDCQLDLFANRMSAQAYKANQLRLLLAAFAYVLIDAGLPPISGPALKLEFGAG